MNYIIGTGHQCPEQIESNADIETRLRLEPGWIERRTGFRSRRYCDHSEATSDLALAAAMAALRDAQVNNEEIGLVLLATSTPDHLLPGTAPMLASELGIDAPAMDLMAACTGFLHALALADAWATATGQKTLLVAANVLSRRVNPQDPQTVGLFGDGAGAVIISPDADQRPTAIEIVGVNGANSGKHWQQLFIPAGGSRLPLDSNNVNSKLRYMKMESGREVFKLAVESMQDLCLDVLRENALKRTDVRWLIAHQASLRIVLELGKRLSIEPKRVAWWLAELGNSSAATIPIALSLGITEMRFKKNDKLLLAAAGSGMSSGAALLKVASCHR